MIFSFPKLFGQEKHDIKPFCILTPFLTKGLLKGLHISKLYRGNPYHTATHRSYSLIETRIGSTYAGDAVLLLRGTPCQRILFIGSCGSLDQKRFPIGSVVVPQICCAMEGFSTMLGPALPFDRVVTPDDDFISKLIALAVKPVHSASVGSIVLESILQSDFQKNGIQALDLECASVFAAAAHVRIPAAALLYVTDIVGETSPFVKPTADHAKKIATAN
ncbi:MAG TPA: hypothetical protein VLJ10_03200, partial [Candidatus Bathyarchaeia archaeon]|nr:hypothetical protein [Candidatus Bathyarchaeia archaeon]